MQVTVSGLAFGEPVSAFAGHSVARLDDDEQVAAILGCLRKLDAAVGRLPSLVCVQAKLPTSADFLHRVLLSARSGDYARAWRAGRATSFAMTYYSG